MALRREEFTPALERHEYSQQVEGYCWPALLAAFLDSRGGSRRRTEIFTLGERLKTTKEFGTWNKNVITFLSERGISWHAEADCVIDRFLAMVTRLPLGVGLFAVVYDWRPRPGYNLRRDPPEPHLVAPFTGVVLPIRTVALLAPRGARGQARKESEAGA